MNKNIFRHALEKIRPRWLRKLLIGSISQAVSQMETPQLRELRQFAEPNFDADHYFEQNPDVQKSGSDALTHWLRHGIWEGRAGPSSLEFVNGRVLEACHGWRNFDIDGRLLSLRVRPDRSKVLQQIMEQAHFEPAVLAAGANAIKNLRTYRGDDLLSRDGINVTGLYDGLPSQVGVLVATPMLVAGGAEKYMVDLVNALAAEGHGPIVVLVTDQTREAAQGWEQLTILAGLKGHIVKFWSDGVRENWGTVDHFARFVQSLRPAMLIVNNSRLGLEAVTRFGRGLSQATKLFCNYFSISPQGVGAPWASRFTTLTCVHATSLTDNEVMQQRLCELTAAIPGTKVAMVPPLAPVVGRDLFHKRLATRHGSLHSGRQRRWVWVSRVEPAKGTEIVRQIALKLPNDHFDIYGPVEPHAPGSINLDAPNIHLQGLLKNVNAADFSTYAGFLFTSLFEGMPNVVLEMAQHAIPMVLADVGGLRHTFDAGSALIVGHAADDEATAARFVDALEQIAGMSSSDVENMVLRAYECVESRHGAAAHRTAVHALLETGEE